jgi:hypothetical protein
MLRDHLVLYLGFRGGTHRARYKTVKLVIELKIFKNLLCFVFNLLKLHPLYNTYDKYILIDASVIWGTFL